MNATSVGTVLGSTETSPNIKHFLQEKKLSNATIVTSVLVTKGI